MCKGLLGGDLHPGVGGVRHKFQSFQQIRCSGQRKNFKVGEGEPHPHKPAIDSE